MTEMIGSVNASSNILRTTPKKVESQSNEESTESQRTKAIEDTVSISAEAKKALAAEKEA